MAKNQSQIEQQQLDNPTAEEALLYCLLVGIDTIADVEGITRLKHFRNVQRRDAYRCIMRLHKEGANPDTTMVSIAMKGNTDDNLIYLLGLTARAVTSNSAAHYARILKELSDRRDLIAQLSNVAKEAHNLDASQEEIAAAVDKARDIADRLMVEANRGMSWSELDDMIGEISWSWENWIPNGMLTMIAGEQDLGKSTLALDLCRIFVNGDNWPNGTAFQGKKGRVLWVDTEGGNFLNLDRAKKWNLDMGAFQTIQVGDEPVNLERDSDRGRFRWWIEQEEIVAVIVDSLRGAFPSGDFNSSQAMTHTQWLSTLAERYKKPIITVHHLNKKNAFAQENIVNLDRVRGSGAITQPVRAVIALDKPDPQSTQLRISMIKLNLARKPKPLGMTITDTGIVFSTDAPDAPRKLSALEEAQEWLMDQLSFSDYSATDILDAAKDNGYSEPTIKRAKNELGIVSQKSSDGRWYWSLRDLQNKDS